MHEERRRAVNQERNNGEDRVDKGRNGDTKKERQGKGREWRRRWTNLIIIDRNDSCTKARSPTNSHTKSLAIDDRSTHLIECSSLFQVRLSLKIPSRYKQYSNCNRIVDRVVVVFECFTISLNGRSNLPRCWPMTPIRRVWSVTDLIREDR